MKLKGGKGEPDMREKYNEEFWPEADEAWHKEREAEEKKIAKVLKEIEEEAKLKK